MPSLQGDQRAQIVREDPSIIAPFRVMRSLDLESYVTAFHYMERFAGEVIEFQKKAEARVLQVQK